MKLLKVECPSCGSNLNASEDESRVTCEFCGATVIVEDSKQEGYNHELGAMKARANVSEQLADAIDELSDPLCSYKRVSAEKQELEKQLSFFEKQLNICEKYGRAISYAAAIILSLVFLLILSAAHAPIAVFLLFAVISILAFPVTAAIVIQYGDNMVIGIKDTQAAITAHEKTLENYDSIIAKHNDIIILDAYRTPRAMKFISDAIRGQRANTLDHAISQYDELLMKEKTIALQEEQIRLQKQQIQETRNLAKGKTVSGGRVVTSNGKQTIVIKQRGHSILFHIFLCWFGIGFITIPYYTISKKHYWHL